MNYDLPKKVNIIMGCPIDDLIKGNSDVYRVDYLVQTIDDKNDLIAITAEYLNKVKSTYYSVNASYKFGFRAKRIEIALWTSDKNLYLCKIIKDLTKVDQAILELDFLANDITRKENVITRIVILYCGDLNDKVRESLRSMTNNKILLIPFSYIFEDKFETLLKNWR